MGSRGESPIRIGPQFDHRELQHRRGRLDGLLVLGPEPGGLSQRGAAGRAVDQDGGHGGRFRLGWVSLLIPGEAAHQNEMMSPVVTE